jgi:hypothetical protein
MDEFGQIRASLMACMCVVWLQHPRPAAFTWLDQRESGLFPMVDPSSVTSRGLRYLFGMPPFSMISYTYQPTRVESSVAFLGLENGPVYRKLENPILWWPCLVSRILITSRYLTLTNSFSSRRMLCGRQTSRVHRRGPYLGMNALVPGVR